MTDLWTGPFGNEYTKRNSAPTDDRARADIWKMLLPRGCESVLEIGANVGRNLEAIAEFSDCDMYACEPNDLARERLHHDAIAPPGHITADAADKLSYPDGVAEVAFTCGVLIHIPPDKLLPSMREIHRCAQQTIICGEYFAPTEEMIPYRGHDHAMWRRDYGGLWLDNFPDLHCVSTMFAWRRMTCFDNLIFWVFRKGPSRH